MVSPPNAAHTRHVRLAVLLGFVVLGVVFWSSPVLTPLKLLVVMMHETGHALATFAVGGRVDQVVVGLDESGACLSRLPPSFFGSVVVYSAGYLGSILASALLLTWTFRFGRARLLLSLICVWLVAMAFFLAGNPLTLGFCLATAAVLGVCARFLKPALLEWLTLFIAAFSGLYAVLDLRDDLWNSAVRSQSDAALLAQVTHVPALFWAILWTAASLLMFGWILRWAWRAGPAQPLTRVPLQNR